MTIPPRRASTARFKAEEPEPPKNRKLVFALAGGGIAAALLAVILVVALPTKDAPAPADTKSDERAATGEGSSKRTSGTEKKSGLQVDEREARGLYEEAEAFERTHADQPDLVAARYRDVLVKFPGTSWATKAEDKYLKLEAALRKLYEAEFESVRLEAAALVKDRRFRDALAALKKFIGATSKEVLRRRAEFEVIGVENGAREDFNRAVKKAEDLARKGDYDGAIRTMEDARQAAIDETAPLCDQAVGDLKESRRKYALHQIEQAAEETERKFVEQCRERLIPLLRARKFDDALKFLESAPAVLKETADLDRALVRAAADFWDAALKTLRSRIGQEVTLALVEGPRPTGKLLKVLPDRVELKGDDGDSAVPLEKFHPDQILLLALRSLPETEAESYAKAAMFFFCDGREDLARIELATAKEMKGQVETLERAFREGYVRAAGKK